MALIQCDDCGTQVSDKAAACPKCACPLGGQKSYATKDVGFGGFVYAVLIGSGIIMMTNGLGVAGFLVSMIGASLLCLRLFAWSGVERK